MGYSSDRLPRVGAIPDRPGVFIMGGFTGHGMPQIFLTAKGLVEIIEKGTTFDNSGIPRLFEESRERLDSKKNGVLDLWRSTQPKSLL
jgi:glycine/D-amino acid oxidase-like deaminating enzyme